MLTYFGRLRADRPAFLVSDRPETALAVNDQVVTAPNTAVSIAILANDADPDGDPLRVAGLTVPLHGSVVHEADQTVTYTPAPDFVGIDDFTYVVADGRGGLTWVSWQ